MNSTQRYVLAFSPVLVAMIFLLNGLGIYPRLAAVALLAFLIPTTILAHAFWQVVGTAMTGGLLFIGATQSQPTLLPHTSSSSGRERETNDTTSLKPVRAL